jgi:hypothetical protein
MSDIHLGSRRDLLIAPLLVAIPPFATMAPMLRRSIPT